MTMNFHCMQYFSIELASLVSKSYVSFYDEFMSDPDKLRI